MVIGKHETNPAPISLAVGLLTGLVTFLILFGIERALGLAATYEWPAGDLAQHVAGAFAYIDGNWSFPIFQTDRINAPDGVNIIFTDSAPAAGLIAKLISSATGLRFNYLGMWFAIGWIGQAAAGAYLIGQLGARSKIVYLCGAVIALACPAYLNRHFHLALGSHFLLLFSLGLYLSTFRNGLSKKTVTVWTLLLGLAIWTHAYLFVMSAALFSAALGDARITGKASTRSAASAFLCVMAISALLAAVGGYGAAGNINAAGYGSFRMDLLAYVWPHGSALLPTPSIFDPQSAFEGYNYLGAGGILAVVLGLVSIRRDDMASLRAHPVLIVVLAAMTLFAITNAISFGGRILVHPPFPTEVFPFSTFRASGRFGWPLGYLAVFVGLSLALRRLGGRWPVAALGLACVVAGLQWADGTQLLKGMREGWQSQPKPILEVALSDVDRVHFAPPINCLPSGVVQNAAIEMLAVVAREGVRSDDAHTARAQTLDCNVFLPASTLDDALVITIPNSVQADFFALSRECFEEAGALVCLPATHKEGSPALE